MIKRPQLTALLSQFYDKPIAQVSLELVFSLFAIIILTALAIRPTLITMSNLIKEIEDKRALSQKLSQKVASLSSVQGEYQALAPRLEVLNEALPSAPQFMLAIKTLDALANESQVVVTNVVAAEVPLEPLSSGATAETGVSGTPDTSAGTFAVPAAPVAPSTTSAAPPPTTRTNALITLTIQGEFANIRRYVEAIQNTRRAMIIDSINFQTVEEAGVKKLQATLSVNIQYFASNAPEKTTK